MRAVLLCGLAGLALAGCTYSTSGPEDDRSVDMEGMVASRHVDITGDAHFAGALVRVRGRVGGDLEAEGASVRIDADVGGDLHAAGASVRVHGDVGGRAEIEGATLRLNSEITGDADLAGARIRIGGVIGGALQADAAYLSISGEVRGPTQIRGQGQRKEGEVEISGRLLQGGMICAEDLRITRNAVLEGEFDIYSASRPDNLPASAAFQPLDGRDCDNV